MPFSFSLLSALAAAVGGGGWLTQSGDHEDVSWGCGPWPETSSFSALAF